MIMASKGRLLCISFSILFIFLRCPISGKVVMILARKDRLMYWPSTRPVTHNTPLYGFLMIVQANTRYQIWEKFISEKYFSSLRQILTIGQTCFAKDSITTLDVCGKNILDHWLDCKFQSDDCHQMIVTMSHCKNELGDCWLKRQLDFRWKNPNQLSAHTQKTQNTQKYKIMITTYIWVSYMYECMYELKKLKN